MLKFVAKSRQFNSRSYRCCCCSIHTSKVNWDLLSQLEDAKTTEKLVKNITARKFKLKSIRQDIEYLRARKFPLPESLSDSQWEKLIRFEHHESRTLYLDSVQRDSEESEYEAILRKDEELNEMADFSVERFAEFAHLVDLDDPKFTLEMRVKRINDVRRAMMESGTYTPFLLNDRAVKELLESAGNFANVEKCLKFFGSKSTMKMSNLIKKRVRQKQGQEIKERVLNQRNEFGHINYGIGMNTVHLRVYPTTIDHYENWNAVREFHHWGQPLVLDLQFLQEMSFALCKKVIAKEVAFAMKRNRQSKEPFQLHICNFMPGNSKHQMILDSVKNIRNIETPVNLTEDSYMNLFDKDKVVYLTPDSNNVLPGIEGDEVFIVGCLSSTRDMRSRTLAQAKYHNIRHARLPLGKYIGLNPELNIDHVVAVMADFRWSKDWFYACRWIPARIFRAQAMINPGHRNEAIYAAHHRLMPSGESEESNLALNPVEYRRRYQEILKEFKSESGIAPEEVDDRNRRHRYKPKSALFKQKTSDLLSDLMS